MASPPYMTVWVADWTADTQHLSCEQDGAYWRLIRAMWRAHGFLPNEPAKLAHVVGLSTKKWLAISDDVLDFFEVDGDHLTHGKLKETLISVSQKSAERVAAGAKGGRAKALKRKEAILANAKDLPSSLPEQTPSISDVKYHTTPLNAREAVDDWPDGKAKDHARLLYEAANTVYLDPSRSHGLVGSEGRLHRWREAGASWEHDVLPTVTGKMQGKRSAVSSWDYFDAAIGESIAANRRALTIPEHDDVHRPRPDRPENAHDRRARAALDVLDELGYGPNGRGEGAGG